MNKDYILPLACEACDKRLDDYDLLEQEEMKGLCVYCYEEAMSAAYEDEWQEWSDKQPKGYLELE